jgi:leader peptidase (prepilin peptidase)/N-methyltransferase
MLVAALGAATGACIGSFVAAATGRWPRGQGVVAGRSRCDSCGRVLGAWELVPVASYVLLSGRCHGCGAAIGWRQPAVELAGALIGFVAFVQDPSLVGLGPALFGWTLLALLVLDFEHFWLPDALTLPLAGLGIAVTAVAGGDTVDRLIGLAAGYLSLALVGGLYRLRTGREGLGGGDPKLLGAIGAWLGWQALPLVVATAAIGGLAWAVVSARRAGTSLDARTRLPFGGFLAVAAWLVGSFA